MVGISFAVDVTGGAVEGDIVALVDRCLPPTVEHLGCLHPLRFRRSRRRSRCPCRGQQPPRGRSCRRERSGCPAEACHALDVLRRGLQTDQNDLFAALAPHSVASSAVKYNFAAGSARRSGQARARSAFAAFSASASNCGCSRASSCLGSTLQNSLFFGDHAFVHQINGDFQSGGSGALAVSGLEHVELAVLNGEFHILHVAVVVFERLRDVHKLLVHLGHDLLELSRSAEGCGCRRRRPRPAR